MYLGFVQAAVYNAVVGVEGQYAPYRFHAHAPRGTSAQAAAVAAAHQVLVTYVPSAQDTLDADYATSLAQIPDGMAKTQGIAFGTRAADDLIRQRAHDGRNADIQFTQPPAPGVWRPTPPQFLPMSAPWLGFVTPLLVNSATQFAPAPPPALTSARYTRDFNEVKALGSDNSTERTADQTATALFFSGNAVVQFNTALRDQVTVRHLDIAAAARMFAAADMSVADALITVWHAKYIYGYWRPITAINLADTDGNPATSPDPNWTPLRTTPNYPEYPSGYNAYTSTESHALENLFETRHLQMTLISTAVPGTQRFYDSGRRAAPGCRQRQDLAGIPLPHRRHRLQGDREGGRCLDDRQLLPACQRERIGNQFRLAAGVIAEKAAIRTWPRAGGDHSRLIPAYHRSFGQFGRNDQN